MVLVDGLGAVGVQYNIQLVPGYNYTHAASNSTQPQGTGAMVQYGNATQLAQQWSSNPPTTIGVIGDIVGSLPIYFKILADVLAGPAVIIIQLANMFPLDTVSANIVVLFAAAIETIWAYLMVTFCIELISGRYIVEG
jgi:hypothetical protein